MFRLNQSKIGKDDKKKCGKQCYKRSTFRILLKGSCLVLENKNIEAGFVQLPADTLKRYIYIFAALEVDSFISVFKN